MAFERVRVDLGDDQRDLGIAAERGGVVDHGGAGLYEPRPPFAGHAGAGGEQRDIEAVDVDAVAQRPHRLAVELPAGGARRRERDDLARGELPFAQQRAHRRADDAGGADHGDPKSAAHRASCPIGRSRWTSARLSWNAEWSAWTARGTASERITHAILIGEVVIISMLMPSAASVSNT